MSGEPKTLTPAEALRRLREEGMELTFDSNDATPWAVHRERGGTLPEYLHFGQTQEEVLSAALGVPVAARDEAAELREENHTLRTEADGWLKRVELLEAAIREWVEATSDAEMFELDQSNAYGTDHADAEDRVEAAAQALRRLAGRESEK